MKRSPHAIEEIAKLEQRIAIRKGKFLDIMNAQIVNSLSREEQEEFFNYLKSKGKRLRLLILFLVSVLSLSLISKSEITGNIILMGDSTGNIVSTIFMVLFFVSTILVIIINIIHLKKMNRFEDHIELTERFIIKSIKDKRDKS